ncbi:MAG TPA: hypothetical protein VKS43_05600 [Burkholderiales bacterium]|nr:hypothetical protein [Burkholderiales bacterium]
MKRRQFSRQRGGVLLAMLFVIAIGASWFYVNRLNDESGGMTAIRMSKNAAVLNRAKQALIGYVAFQAGQATEPNPGALPCPENPGDFNSTTGNDGKEGSTCGATTVGRFPWRTLGLDKLVDAYGEPLWYVVSPNWGVASGSNSDINSNTLGQLTVNGVPNAAVALIIAPGPAFFVPAAAGCTAWNQVRTTTAPPDWRNYLECDNATTPADASFVATGPSTSFNDQVMVVTVADVMPAIEAAIADRTNREIVPALNSVYTAAGWGFSGSNPVYPFAAPWGNTANPGTSNYQGAPNTYNGLLPFFQTQGCNPASDPRCTTATTGGSAFLVFSKFGNESSSGSGSIRTQSTCSWQSTAYVCTGQYNQPTIAVTFKFKVTNVAMGLRALDTTKVVVTAMNDTSGGWGTTTISSTTTATLNSDGSATFTVTTDLLPDIVTAGWGTYADYVISIDRAAVGDHSLLDSTSVTNGSTGWFVRNEWYRLIYYAVTSRYTTGTLPPSCTTGIDCLSAITNVTPAGAQRAILILAGSSVNGVTRPGSSPTLQNYLEGGNASGTYVRQTVRTSMATPAAQRFNDRIVVIGSN